MDMHKDKFIKTGTLKKTGGAYTLFLQTPGNINAILGLQDKVFDGLTAEEQAFLLRKNRQFFEGHFHGDNLVLGVMHEGKLIAQSIVTNPSAASPKTGMTDMALDVPSDKVTVLQGVVVDPEYRGNSLMTIMVDAWLAIAKEQGRTTAIAEVAVDNFYSWTVFMKEGLAIQSIGTDPADGTEVYNLSAKVAPLIRKRLKGDFNKAAKKHTVDVPQADIAAQKKLLLQGYKGVDFDHANMNIKFAKAKKVKISGAKP
jgi:ribosomal protein S18 acetylase RimI-like enzyme